MRSNGCQNRLFSGVAVLAACAAIALIPHESPAADAATCPTDDSGLTLPAGFCATVFADAIGHARHLVVSESGVVYVNTWSGRYYGNDTPHAGGFLVALKDSHGAGKADLNERFGETVQSGGAGGTGIGIYNGWLYAELNDKILKYPLSKGSIRPGEKSQVVVRGLPLGGDHPMHPLCHRRERRSVYRCGERDQFVPGKESHPRVTGDKSVHRTRDARRYLAL